MEKNGRKNPQAVRPAVLSKLLKFAKAVENNDIAFVSIYLFGSHAKGTSTKNSDIDICVVQPDVCAGREFDERLKIMRVATELNLNTDIVVSTETEFKTNRVSPILHEIRKHCVLIFGKKTLPKRPETKIVSIRL